MASGFDAVLDPAQLKEFGVGQRTVADVLSRVVMAAPDAMPRVDIAKGPMLPGLAELPQGSVSRATSLLLKLGFLAQEHRRVERPGRPIIPLRLGPEWILVGISVRHSGGRPVEVAGMVTALDGSEQGQRAREELSGSEDEEVLVKVIADVVKRLTKGERRKILGVGVEVGGHVHQGRVIFVPSAAANRWPPFPLGEMLNKELSGLSVVVENDVNARAVSEIWRKAPGSHELRFPQPHFAVAAVLDEGVGGALVVDRKIHVRGRETGHLAVQIGHLTVEYPRRWVRTTRPSNAGAGLRGFGDPCRCVDAAGEPPGDDRGYGHVDALATPARIAGELGIRFGDFARAAQEPGADPDGRLTRTGEVFRAAGQALGRGIDVMLNIADPVSLLLLLPPALACPAASSAAAEYARAVEGALNRGRFSSSGRPALLVESTGPYPFAGARAPATCVLDVFLAYARGEDTGSRPDTSRARTA